MKKFFNYVCLAVMAASIIVACSKNEKVENLPTSSVKKVNFSAKSANPGTKSYFGEKTSSGYPTVWTSNQKVKLSLNYATAKDAEVTPSGDGKTASFSVSITDDESGNYVFYALSPASAYVAISGEFKSWNVLFPTSQKPTMTSVDEAAHIMAAKSATYTKFPAASDPVSLSFSHIAAYGKFKLKNFPAGETIEGIDLAAAENIAGRVYFYPESGTYSDNSAQKIISIDVSNLSSASNAEKVFWFAIKPVNLEGKTLKITVHATGGDYIKTITFPSGTGNFQAGRVASFNIDMTGITPSTSKVYTLITDYNQLLPNSEVIIVARDANFALSTTQNENNRGQAAITKSEDKLTISSPSDAVQLFSLEAGSVSNTVAFKCKNGGITVEGYYIGSAASGSNFLRTFSTKDANTSFKVFNKAGDSDHSAFSVLRAQGDYTNNTIRYNSSSSLFSCYLPTSTQAEVAIYKLNGSGDGTTPLVSEVKHSVTFGSATNGSFTVKVNDSNISSGEQVAEDTKITLNASPAEGYDFSNWTVNGETLTDNPATISMGESDIVISATFKEKITGYELTFPDDNKDNNKVSNYTSTWTAKSGEKAWTIKNFNNNSWGWTVIKCGRKSYDSTGEIISGKFTEAIKKVELTIDNITDASKVSSIKLFVATNSGFTSGLQTITGTKSTGTQTFTIPTPTANCYYKLEFVCTSASGNGVVSVSKIAYIY